MRTFETIRTTAGEATAELQRRGIRPADPIIITIDPAADQLTAARSACRAKVAAAGHSDADIEALIAKARAEVAIEAE